MKKEETLDPEDWEATRQLGHAMLDDMFDYLSSIRERPAWQSVPDDVKTRLKEETPKVGAPLSQVYDAFKKDILPYPTGNQHPGFFGWVMGNGTVTGMLADMLASGMNPHVAGYDQTATIVERQVIAWFADLLDFGADTSGLLVSGGTMANMNGLAVARNEKAGFDIRNEGLQSPNAKRLRVYGSAQTHNWIIKCSELMGMGRDAFRPIPVNDRYEVDIDAYRAQIEQDIKNGDKPFCVLGTAGTVNTGAIDDLVALRNLADEFDLWFHIDGAFGALAGLADQSKDLVKGQGLADSLAFDLHKWGYMPYEVGCVLVKSDKAHVGTFEQKPSYLVSGSRGLSVETTYFADKGLQLSRGFRALKVWMSLKEQGADKLGRLIQQNIDQAKYLEELVQAHPALELMAPVSLNIVCFRYRGDEGNLLSDEDGNRINEEILMRIQESGSAAPSHTVLHDKYALRVCITNHRTVRSDLAQLVKDVVVIGGELTQ